MNRKYRLIIVLTGLFIIIFFQSIYVIDYGCKAIVERNGNVVRTIDGECKYHLKIPFIEDVQSYPTQNIVYDIDNFLTVTKDNENVIFSCYAIYDIPDVLSFYENFGTIDELQKRINNATCIIGKEVIINVDEINLIKLRESNIEQILTAKIKQKFRGKGIQIKKIGINDFAFII